MPPGRHSRGFRLLWASAARYLFRFLPLGARAAVFNAASATGVVALAADPSKGES